MRKEEKAEVLSCILEKGQKPVALQSQPIRPGTEPGELLGGPYLLKPLVSDGLLHQENI